MILEASLVAVADLIPDIAKFVIVVIFARLSLRFLDGI